MSKTKEHKKKKSKTQETLGGCENKNIEETKDVNVNESSDVVGRTLVANNPVSMSNNFSSPSANNATKNINSSNLNGGNPNTTNTNKSNTDNMDNCEALHLATVAQTLKCIKKMRESGNNYFYLNFLKM